MVAMICCSQVTLFFWVDTIWVLCAAVTLLLPLQISAITINHNHHHLNFLHFRLMNRIFESVLYFQTGTSPYSWTLHHNIGHHKFYLDQEKDTSRWKRRNGQKMGRIEYTLCNAMLIYPEIVRVGRAHPKIFRKFVWMFFLNNLVLLTLVVLAPLKALIIFIVPMLLMIYVLVDTTYAHHVGLETDHHLEASHNRLAWLYNRCTWNLGYHTAHHMRPGAHWTRLPELHQEIENEIPDVLLKDSTHW